MPGKWRDYNNHSNIVTYDYSQKGLALVRKLSEQYTHDLKTWFSNYMSREQVVNMSLDFFCCLSRVHLGSGSLDNQLPGSEIWHRSGWGETQDVHQHNIEPEKLNSPATFF